MTPEEINLRPGFGNEEVIRHIMRLPQEERMGRAIFWMDVYLNNMWNAFRDAKPNLSDYQLTLLMYECIEKYSEKYGWLSV